MKRVKIQFDVMDQAYDRVVREVKSYLERDSVSIRKIESSAEESPNKVMYPPQGAENIRSVLVAFNKKVSKDKAESLAAYWGSIPFVGLYAGVNWIDEIMLIKVDVSESRSSDVKARSILEFLQTILEDGPSSGRISGLGAGSVSYVYGKTTEA